MKYRYLAFGLVGAAVIIGAAVWALHAGASKPAAPTAVSGTYVALGDSVAAGVGLEDYSDASACNRTQESYPHAVASGLKVNLVSIACSGAATTAGVLASQNVNNLPLPPQIEALFTRPAPEYISLTIGANDMRWTDLLAKCYTAVCGTPADMASLEADIPELKANLALILHNIRVHYGTASPRVAVTGYYQLFPVGSATCADATGLDASELTAVREQQTKLNAAIRAAAEGQKNVTFVPVDFAGHELCSTDPWVQGVSAAAPFHPTAAGEAAYANAVMAAFKSTQGETQP